MDGKETTCPKCGSTLSTTTIQATAFDINTLKKQPDIISAALAFVFCLFPWVSMQAIVTTVSFSSLSLARPFATSDAIFAPALVLLLPACLVLIVLSAFVPKLVQYKRILVISSVGLVLYSTIGLYQLTHPEIPEPIMNTSSAGLNNIMRMAQGAVQDAYGVGIGFYLTFAAVLACAFFSGILRKKKA